VRESSKQLQCIPFLVMTGHINVMLVLQSCTDSLHILPGSSSETFPTSSDGTCDGSNTAVQQNMVVIEEGSIAVNKEAPTAIKQEEIPEDKTFPDLKTEPDGVSCVCVCLLLDTFYHCPEMSIFVVTSIFLTKSNSCTVGNENVLL